MRERSGRTLSPSGPIREADELELNWTSPESSVLVCLSTPSIPTTNLNARVSFIMASTSYRTGSLLRSALSSSRVSSSSSSAARRASAVPSSTRSFSLLPRIGSPSRATPLTSSSRMAPTSALCKLPGSTLSAEPSSPLSLPDLSPLHLSPASSLQPAERSLSKPRPLPTQTRSNSSPAPPFSPPAGHTSSSPPPPPSPRLSRPV